MQMCCMCACVSLCLWVLSSFITLLEVDTLSTVDTWVGVHGKRESTVQTAKHIDFHE